MGLNDTPKSERFHIGIFGKRNAGKSSLINALTGQTLSVVSDIAGTTTDPVGKAMEILPAGPVLITDTPGLDDEGALGSKRVESAKAVLKSVDLALLVTGKTLTDDDLKTIDLFSQHSVPYIIVHNKCDLYEALDDAPVNCSDGMAKDVLSIQVSALLGKNINKLRELIADFAKDSVPFAPIISDLAHPMDTVVLVIPIDESAPKGRLILPQQQTIRELLEVGAISVCIKETELSDYFEKCNEKGALPQLVVTDSQAFKAVSKIVPASVPLTSFSILMAKHKGNLEAAIDGAKAIEKLTDDSIVLISEGCTHHRQCNDIGTKKLPALIRSFAGCNPTFEYTSGKQFSSENDIKKYSLVIHCGGCMLNAREMQHRYRLAKECDIPVTNYGIALSHMNGILERCTFFL